MKCPECNAWALVLQTRQCKTENVTTRRYECANGHRFSTIEQPASLKTGKPLEQKPNSSKHMKKD